MLRQMEYDADHYEIHLSGSDTFEQTTQRIHVLSGSLEKSYKEMRSIWNINKNLPDDLSSFLLWQLSRVPEAQIQKLQNTIGLEPTRPFGTHPSNGDRIRNARQMACPGVFELELPASILFGHFEALSKQVTRLHYEDDLGMPMELTKLRPVASFSG